MAIRILIVDDEPAVRAGLRTGLEAEGFVVSEAGGEAQMRERLEREPDIALITLDLKLGQSNGLELARTIRAERNIPIVMVTALGAPIDRVTGLEHGADDYIVKPFHIREVVMRLRHVLRRYELEGQHPDREPAKTDEHEHEQYRFETGSVDARLRTLTAADGTPIELTTAELDLLLVFLRHPGRVMTRDDIMLHLKGRQWSPIERTVDGHIARLRKKIEPDIARPRLIKTVWRVGYVFTGEVSRAS